MIKFKTIITIIIIALLAVAIRFYHEVFGKPVVPKEAL